MAKNADRIAKPTYFNKKNDVELLEWLEGKGGYSSYIRVLLYEVYNREKKGNYIFSPNSLGNSNNKEDITDGVSDDKIDSTIINGIDTKTAHVNEVFKKQWKKRVLKQE